MQPETASAYSVSVTLSSHPRRWHSKDADVGHTGPSSSRGRAQVPPLSGRRNDKGKRKTDSSRDGQKQALLWAGAVRSNCNPPASPHWSKRLHQQETPWSRGTPAPSRDSSEGARPGMHSGWRHGERRRAAAQETPDGTPDTRHSSSSSSLPASSFIPPHFLLVLPHSSFCSYKKPKMPPPACLRPGDVTISRGFGVVLSLLQQASRTLRTQCHWDGSLRPCL